MRESRTSGSVRGLGRESLVYSTAEDVDVMIYREQFKLDNKTIYNKIDTVQMEII